ncbi:MAG: HAD family hydrolase [Roseitalea sp.]|nr:HAD family hydrolase [Roseitalea sp.]MBO6745286.1 HAD family hydrolase [Roseitalea sp.]
MSTTPIDLIVIDIDRTTLTDDYRLLPEVTAAVGRAQRAGITVCAATARSPGALRPIASELGLIGQCVCLNGAWIGVLGARSDTVLMQSELDLSHVVRLIKKAEEEGLNPCWFTEDMWWTLSEGPLVARESRATKSTPSYIGDLAEIRGPIFKLLILEDPQNGIFAEAVQHEFDCHFDFTRSDTFLIEITQAGVSKRSAVEKLAVSIGYERHRIAAVGDSENDLELIKWSGFGVAMGNATAAVKGAADWVTKSNADAGVAHAIDKIMAANTAINDLGSELT